MKKLALVMLACFVILACKKQHVDENFDKYKTQFVEDLWKVYPNWASDVGYHHYDSVLTILDDNTRAAELQFCNNHLELLKQFNIDELNNNNKTDFRLIENFLNRNVWSINEYKDYEWNPSEYNVSSLFATMLMENYDSLDNRLLNIKLKLKQVPAYYQAAINNIKNPTKEHTELGISQNQGGLSVFTKDLPEAINKSNLSETEKEEINNLSLAATESINNYINWLKNLNIQNPRSFRLGSSLFDRKFEFNIQSSYTANQIYQKALDRKQYLHTKMEELAVQLWPKYMGNKTMPQNKLEVIKQVIDQISLNHVNPDSFQIEIEKQIPQLVDFVNQKNLIYLDPSKPLVVRKEPDYMAGVAGASISAPGPYEVNGNTYYNVGSLSGWDSERSESYLREYNHYMMQILNIHEAIPGHYTQLIYSNQSPSIIKSILGNGAMREGWAVYTELMMLENGYGNNLPELWLMYYKFNLRTTCNTILDIGVHTKNMSKEDALNLLINEAFQQQAEAEGKWRRVTLTSVQLCSYFTGFTEIYELREELKAKQNTSFDLKQFHEQFLSYGSAPVKYIKSMMLP